MSALPESAFIPRVDSEAQARWNERYASGDYQPTQNHSPLVEEAVEYVVAGRALVLACGTGRNALYLASRGFEVDAVDVSTVAIEMAKAEAAHRRLEVDWHVADANSFELGVERYDLITMIRYTNREILPRLPRALSRDGWVLMEQHLRTRHPVAGPSDEFRLAPGELLDAFPDLRVIKYTEEYGESAASGRMIATTTLLACKGDPGW